MYTHSSEVRRYGEQLNGHTLSFDSHDDFAKRKRVEAAKFTPVDGSLGAPVRAESSQQGSAESTVREPTEADIDLTLMGSFPASDPPSWTLGIPREHDRLISHEAAPQE